MEYDGRQLEEAVESIYKIKQYGEPKGLVRLSRSDLFPKLMRPALRKSLLARVLGR